MEYLDKLDRRLKGAPERVLTACLLLAGAFAWLIGLYGSPSLKAAVLAWMVAP